MRFTLAMLLAASVATTACGDSVPLDPFELAGATFGLGAFNGEPVPAYGWDFLGDSVFVESGQLEFTAVRYFELVTRCVHDCAAVQSAGNWTRSGDEVQLIGDLGRDLVATFDGASLSYDDYAGRTYLWERR